MKIFETHAHYDDEIFDEDRDVLLREMFSENGIIDKIVNVGASIRGCEESISLANRYDSVFAAIGVHPSEVEELTENKLKWLKKEALDNKKVVAIGEIGLDYHYPEPSKELQIQKFREQLVLAHQVNKPVIIHSREACADTIDCMKKEHAQELGGIIHCYSYSKETARDFLNMGFYFGIGGVVTFKNARKLVEAVEYIPMDRIVLETDCPYMSPEPFRGKRNDSTRIPYIVNKIAEIKGICAQEVIDITHSNACDVFKLK